MHGARNSRGTSSPDSLPRLLDEFGDAIEFFSCDASLLMPEQCSHYFLDRTFKKGIDHMRQYRLANGSPWKDGLVNIPKLVFSVSNVPFSLE